MPPAPAAVLFDLDGTLADTLADLAASVNFVRAGRGLPPLPDPEIAKHIGDGAEALMARTVAPLEGEALSAAARQFKAHYLEHCLDRTRPFPGIPETLQHLAGIPLGIVSNKPRLQTARIARAFGWEARFGAIVAGDDLPQRKPDPRPLFAALARLGAQAAGSWMVGDSTNDLAAGRAAGMRTLAVAWGLQPLDRLLPLCPEAVAREPGDLPGILIAGR